MRRAAQANRRLPAGRGSGNVFAARQDHRQRPGPERLHQTLGKWRHAGGVVDYPCRIGHMHDQRMVGGPALGRKNPGYCFIAGRIGAQAIDGFSRKADQFAGPDASSGLDNSLRVGTRQNHQVPPMLGKPRISAA